MKILFAATEKAWRGFLKKSREELPEHHFTDTGHFGLDIGGSTDVSIRGIVSAVAENIRRVARNQGPLYLAKNI
jgi:hypothetical protein